MVDEIASERGQIHGWFRGVGWLLGVVGDALGIVDIGAATLIDGNCSQAAAPSVGLSLALVLLTSMSSGDMPALLTVRARGLSLSSFIGGIESLTSVNSCFISLSARIG